MSDGFEGSTEFLPLAFSREQIAGQMQTIGSIEGRARVRKVLTTAREKGLRVCPLPGCVPLNRSHHAPVRRMAVVARGRPVEAVEARLDVPPNGRGTGTAGRGLCNPAPGQSGAGAEDRGLAHPPPGPPRPLAAGAVAKLSVSGRVVGPAATGDRQGRAWGTAEQWLVLPLAIQSWSRRVCNSACSRPGSPDPACSVLRPAAHREPLDITPVWPDSRAHRAARVATEVNALMPMRSTWRST